MISLEGVESWLADWDLPLGPFKTIEEVYDSMESRALSLGPGDADTLAALAAKLARQRHRRLNVLSIFLQKYAEQNGEVFAESLLRELGPDGPPLLLDLIGSTGARKAIPRVVDTLDIERGGSDLLVAWAGALGELGGKEAEELLHQLEGRPGLDQRTAAEVRIALECIGVSTSGPNRSWKD